MSDKDLLNKISEDQEKMAEDIQDMKLILVRQEENLRVHIYRTELSEENIKLLRQQLVPMENHVKMVNGVFKFIGLVSLLVGIVVGIINIINNEIVNNTTNIYQSISQIIGSKQGDNHESILIENTVNVSETVLSSWSVIPYNQQMGEFKAVVAVRNKITNTIITLISLLSFDYSDAIPALIQNDLLTDAALSLTVGVDVSNMLYVTVLGMPEDDKRIHFCMERCVLSERAMLMEAYGEFNLTANAELTAFIMASALGNLSLNGSAELIVKQPDAYEILYNHEAIWGANSIFAENWGTLDFFTWQSIISTLGGMFSAGGHMKDVDPVWWNNYPDQGDNSTGLSLRGAGMFSITGEHGNFGGASYLAMQLIDKSLTGVIYIQNNQYQAQQSNLGDSQNIGVSVRPAKIDEGESVYTGLDGKTYPVCRFCGYVFVSAPFKETKLRDGSLIPIAANQAEYISISGAKGAWPNFAPSL